MPRDFSATMYSCCVCQLVKIEVKLKFWKNFFMFWIQGDISLNAAQFRFIAVL